MSHDFKCPYCNAPFEVCHDDGHGYEEGVMHHDECGACDKQFVFFTSISLHFEPEKADCLNDGKHIWKAQRTFPVEYTRMRCETCDAERNPTDEEMAAIVADWKNHDQDIYAGASSLSNSIPPSRE